MSSEYRSNSQPYRAIFSASADPFWGALLSALLTPSGVTSPPGPTEVSTPEAAAISGRPSRHRRGFWARFTSHSERATSMGVRGP